MSVNQGRRKGMKKKRKRESGGMGPTPCKFFFQGSDSMQSLKLKTQFDNWKDQLFRQIWKHIGCKKKRKGKGYEIMGNI